MEKSSGKDSPGGGQIVDLTGRREILHVVIRTGMNYRVYLEKPVSVFGGQNRQKQFGVDKLGQTNTKKIATDEKGFMIGLI